MLLKPALLTAVKQLLEKFLHPTGRESLRLLEIGGAADSEKAALCTHFLTFVKAVVEDQGIYLLKRILNVKIGLYLLCRA